MDALFMGLWMGFLAAGVAFVGVLLFWKTVQGEITFQEAVVTWSPLALCFLLLYITRGSALSWLFGFAGVGYLYWYTMRRRSEEKQIEEDLIAHDLDKWGRAVEEDEGNAGAHLYLGNALVQRGDLDAAAGHYQRALELDPTNVRELLLFLSRREDAEAGEIRSRLPDLDRIARAVRERSTFGKVVSGPANPPEPGGREAGRLTPAVAEGDGPPDGPPPTPELGGESGGQPITAPERVLFGYETEEERYADQERLGRIVELRKVVDDSPDDLSARMAYAAALEEAGYPVRAAEEYEHIAAADPANEDAAGALARLRAAAEAEAAEAVPDAAVVGSFAGEGESGGRRLARLARLREFLAAGENDPGARLAYAQALEVDGLLEGALEQYRRVLEQEPGNPEAAAGLGRLECSVPAGLQIPAAEGAAPTPTPPPAARA